MNRWKQAGMVGAVVVAMGTAQTWAGILGGPHDFAAADSPFHNSMSDACAACHTPHHATSQAVPLWSRGTNVVSTFIPYTSASLNAGTAGGLGKQLGQPQGVSLACLSCHDGTVAISGGHKVDYVNPDASLGTDLRDDHPISFTYDTALANPVTGDAGLFDPSVKLVPAAGGNLAGKTIKAALLKGDSLECSSCHDVHGSRGDAANSPLLLVIPTANSALCLTCHDK